LGEESRCNNVQSDAAWCQEELHKVLDATAKMITIWVWSKRWWIGENNEKRSELGREKRRRRRSVATALARAELQKSIRRAKDWMRNNSLKNQRGAGNWRAGKFAN